MVSEINSLEWYKIIVHEAKPEEEFAHYDVISTRPYIMRLSDGREFVLNDDPPNTNRERPIEELLALGRVQG